MSTQVTANFEVKSWDEDSPNGDEGPPKITHASVTKGLSGDIEGEAAVEYLMAYGEDGTAVFVGLERVDGSIDGKAGSFVLQHVGRFEDGVAKGALTVAPGTGTADLAGLAGEGEFSAERGPNGSMSLSVTFG